MNNISFIYGPKEKNPFTGKWDNQYLVPAVKDQQGIWNYIVVTCCPSMNGVYRWNNVNRFKYKTWMNGKNKCYYINKDDCNYKKFDELDMERPINQKIIEEVKKMQEKWYKGQVKNKDAYKRKKPEWML